MFIEFYELIFLRWFMWECRSTCWTLQCLLEFVFNREFEEEREITSEEGCIERGEIQRGTEIKIREF